MSKIKLVIVLCVIAVIFAFFGNCNISCKIGSNESGNSVSVPENQEAISETESSRP